MWDRRGRPMSVGRLLATWPPKEIVECGPSGDRVSWGDVEARISPNGPEEAPEAVFSPPLFPWGG